VNCACIDTLGPKNAWLCKPGQNSIPTGWHNCKVCPFKRYIVRILASESFHGWWFSTGKFQDSSLEWITTTSSLHTDPSWFPVVPLIEFPDTFHRHHHVISDITTYSLVSEGNFRCPSSMVILFCIRSCSFRIINVLEYPKFFVLFKLPLIHK
jgi:hypothetical protein